MEVFSLSRGRPPDPPLHSWLAGAWRCWVRWPATEKSQPGSQLGELAGFSAVGDPPPVCPPRRIYPLLQSSTVPHLHPFDSRDG